MWKHGVNWLKIVVLSVKIHATRLHFLRRDNTPQIFFLNMNLQIRLRATVSVADYPSDAFVQHERSRWIHGRVYFKFVINFIASLRG